MTRKAAAAKVVLRYIAAMARKANTFTGMFESLLTEMAALNMLAFNERCVHESNTKALAKKPVKSGANPFPELRGAYLTGPDLFASKTSIFTFAGCTVSGSELVAMNEETQQRLNGLVVCSAVEAMSEYLNRIAGAACWHSSRRLAVPKNNMRKYEQMKKVQPKARGTLPYYRGYMAWLSERNHDEVVKHLLTLVPSLKNEAVTRKGQDLFRFFKSVRLVRHLIIHGRGRSEQERLRCLSKDEQAFTQSMVRNSVLHGDKRILPTSNEVSDTIWRLCSLAYVVYRETSQKCAMKQEYSPSA